ncbi:MAG: MMPL family transporter [Thermodesulfobacteriota bacterium]
MKLLLWMLHGIRRVATAFPIATLTVFILLAAIGFYLMQFIDISTDLLAGVDDKEAVIRLTRENIDLFGEQDSVILVLEFPGPAGEIRKPFIEALGESLKKFSGVRRVVYRFLDPEDEQQIAQLFTHFLRGMNQRERQAIQGIFTPQGMADALRRNRNRLFLVQNPYLERRILEDPLELGQFVASSFTRRVGNISIGDIYLFIGSPDSSVFLIQVTPDFHSADVAKSRAFVDRLHESLPRVIEQVSASIEGDTSKLKGLKWYLTGKTVFQHETDVVFDHETLAIIVVAFLLVSGVLIFVYRSLTAVGILVIPMVIADGLTYGLVYISYSHINPVVMGSSAIVFGLGTDYVVHLWGKFREEFNHGLSVPEAMTNVYQQAGPAVAMGALTNVIAFACLCLSDQPAMRQFGYVCSLGLALTLLASLCLVPALATLLARAKKDYFPTSNVRFAYLSRLFLKNPRLVVAMCPVIIAISVVFGLHLSYEKDLYKVFLATQVPSMEVVQKISQKFQSNFAQPTFLSFDVDDPETGVLVQRQIDSVLEKLMESEAGISTFDSISYLTAPRPVQEANVKAVSGIVDNWSQLQPVFSARLAMLDFSQQANQVMMDSFDKTLRILKGVNVLPLADSTDGPGHVERTWYQAKVGNKYRFLTKVRYAHSVNNPDRLMEADRKMLKALEEVPVPVRLSGTRQVMEAILGSLVGELFRLGLIGAFAVLGSFLLIYRNPLATALSIIPMAGSFCITLGALGALGVGIPFSIIAVAPLIFGLCIDSAMHVVMRTFDAKGVSVEQIMKSLTPPIVTSTVTNALGFLALTISQQYSMQFLGWALFIGLAANLLLTIVTLPAFMFLLESRRKARVALGT